MKKETKSFEEAQAYMCNLPKIYIQELKLSKDIFEGLLGHLCDLEQDEQADDSTPKYMPLKYDVAQKYCKDGFPTKYFCKYYSQYLKTLYATILIYYIAIGSGEHELSDEEYEKLCQRFDVSAEDLDASKVSAIISYFELENPGKIEKAKLAGECQRTFDENWKSKYTQLLKEQIENVQIVWNNVFLGAEEIDRLTDEGATLKRVINFLDKLESESHERNGDKVLIPDKEYHALHIMLSKRPWEKAKLKEKHDKIVHKWYRAANLESRKKD